MAYMFLGGVFGACGLLKDLTNKTMVEKSYGLMLIPGVFTLLSVLTIAQDKGQSLLLAIPTTLTGTLIAVMLGKGKKL
ncbi:hypothetical protein B484DRAFT_389434 [Ochromonadaceae sp. CCMP2298]|nr:hypothetical protein B484DRAFT_389434 [Ochromonadaceae sp. CCMP2298]